MSKNISIFSDPNVPAANRRRGVSPLTQSIVTGGSLRRIQTSNKNTFRRIIGGDPIGKPVQGELDVIIVNLLPKVGRVFYAGVYDPDAKGSPPDCWSNDGVAPEADVAEPQARSCNACPNNIDGSGQDGRGKACRFKRLVAVLVAGDPSGETYQFGIPAKSLFGQGQGHTHPFQSYVKYLVANDYGIDDIVTKIAYDEDATTMVMNFTPVRPITDEEAELVEAAQRDPETQRMIQFSMGEAAPKPDPVPEKKASIAGASLRAAALAAKAEAEEDEEEEEEEEEAPAPAPEPSPAPKPKAARKPKVAPVVVEAEEEEEEEAEPAPAPAPAPKAAAKPKASANPFDDDDDEDGEVAVAPVRRAAAKPKAEAPKLKPGLADVISDWASADEDD